MKKLKNKRGESLIEALAAILIFTLGSVVLYSMITTSTYMNAQAKQTDADNQALLTAVEKGVSGAGTAGTVSMSLNGTKTMGSVEVEIYGDTGGLYAYYVAQGDGT